MDIVRHVTLRVCLRRAWENSAARAHLYSVHSHVGEKSRLRIKGGVVRKTPKDTVFVAEAMIDTGIGRRTVIDLVHVCVVVGPELSRSAGVRSREQFPVLQRNGVELV